MQAPQAVPRDYASRYQISKFLFSSPQPILCRYAKLEKDVGEIDRARAIYVHAASLANPATDKPFWQAWNDFEVVHGNEDTFREMRRVMRSVQASFAQTHFNTAIIDAVGQSRPSGASKSILSSRDDAVGSKAAINSLERRTQ